MKNFHCLLQRRLRVLAPHYVNGMNGFICFVQNASIFRTLGWIQHKISAHECLLLMLIDLSIDSDAMDHLTLLKSLGKEVSFWEHLMNGTFF